MDLNRCGVYVYAEHHSTDLWCMAFAFDDEEPHLVTFAPGTPRFRPAEGHGREEFARLLDHVRGGGELRAWNAQFERVIWREILGPRYGFPVPRMEQWVCTAAEAAAMSLPHSLDKAARALGVEDQKDAGGSRLMKQMARPRRPRKGERREGPLWWDDLERRERLYAYCLQDVRTERAVARRLRRLTPFERRVYLQDQTVNDRGVPFDTSLIEAAKAVVVEGAKRANEEIDRITAGEVDSVTKIADLTAWLRRQGVDVEDVRKETIRDLLEGDLAADVRRVVEIRAEAGRSSTAKLDAILRSQSTDGRARGLLLYHGAGTGRWAGRRIQPQNFPRGEIRDVEAYIPRILARDYDAIAKDHPPIVVVSSLLRGTLRASPGRRFIGGDYSQIEARVLAWIAGQTDLTQQFAAGAKIYENMASRIYGIPAGQIANPSDERNVGKTVVLGAGFQMGADTFAAQLQRQTGIVLPRGARDEDGELLPGEVDEAARVIQTYRGAVPRIRRFWYEIEDAAIQAVKHPGRVTHAGAGPGIKYLARGSWLWCVLPSGRALAYAKPKLAPRTLPWGEVKEDGLSALGVDSTTKQWVRQHLYGGRLTENVVQAMARDVMAAAMLRLEAQGYPIILTVHDELISEVPYGQGSPEDFERLMLIRPRWAAGLPVAAETWEGERYR